MFFLLRVFVRREGYLVVFFFLVLLVNYFKVYWVKDVMDVEYICLRDIYRSGSDFFSRIGEYFICFKYCNIGENVERRM